jgi:hypothetical protein
MAIEVTTLSSYDGVNVEVLKEWFDTNATSFFSGSEIVDNELQLKVNNVKAVGICFTDSRYIKIYVNNDCTITVTFNSLSDYIKRLAKTSYGIAISGGNSGLSSTYPYGVFITKTSNNNVGIVLAKSQSQNITANGFYIVSIGGSLISSSATAIAFGSMHSGITTLTNCVCEEANGEYLPECYLTSFSQYKEYDCVFTADGKEYLYNGFIAMR